MARGGAALSAATSPDRRRSHEQPAPRYRVENGLGRSRWQPATADGKREWLRETWDISGGPTYVVPAWRHPENATGLRPRLYRSRLHASFVARRYERREAAKAWEEA